MDGAVTGPSQGLALLGALALAGTLATTPVLHAEAQASAGPPVWTDADKVGFGTAASRDSKVWYTLGDGRLEEVYHPRLDVPSVRELQLVVSDGETFAELESEATTQVVELVDDRALAYRQINTARSHRYEITKTYTTDPARDALLVDVEFEALDGGDYEVYVRFDPQLDNTGRDDEGWTRSRALVATDSDSGLSSALLARPALGRTDNGFDGVDEAWLHLRDHFELGDTADRTDGVGDVVQLGELRFRQAGRGTRRATLALGFGTDAREARGVAQRSMATGFDRTLEATVDGWHAFLDTFGDRPDSVARWPVHYDVSLMVLKASEDKSFPGAGIASPSMPWAWGDLSVHDPSGPYHLVWPRDLYQVATTMLAAGDRETAEHALDFLFEHQQLPDGSFPQNSRVDGEQFWDETQMDQASFPLILAWQLDRDDEATVREHVEPAADFVVENGPATDQERWEESPGYSPSTLAAQIAGLVCAAELMERIGDTDKAAQYLAVADDWQQRVEEWTFTTTGPLGDGNYYLRIVEDGNPDDGDDLELANGAGTFDEREIVDAGFLELVRLGVKPADDPAVVASLPVIDEELLVRTPNGPVWHRYSHDGYGETNRGEPWGLERDGTIGRLWPILTGERGEYELAAGRDAREHLDTIARTANEGYLMPEQVWDRSDPEPEGFAFGEGTKSATPLGWTHAQFVRLAWSVDAGAPVETPSVVACRYAPELADEGGCD